VEPFGLGLMTVGLFVGFGLLIGTLFGFFGMGGSFLVTPGLLVLGYPAKVAVGSGLAFVFGTSVIGALRHRNLGQVDYALGMLMVVGMTVGIEFGSRLVFLLEAVGLAGTVVSVAYVGLLAGVGLFVLSDWREGDDGAGGGDREGDGSTGLAARIQGIRLWPVVSLRGDVTASAWVVIVLGLGIGVLSGFLGVGGGFLLMPAMLYGLGVPAAIAVGTSIFQITLSGAYGSFVFAQQGAVDVPVVASLLLGSALGARVGAGATHLVDEDEIKGYFAAMLLSGAVAVASKEVAGAYGVPVLHTLSVVLIFGTAVLVTGAILYAAVGALRQAEGEEPLSS